jgi:hypothetical protein
LLPFTLEFSAFPSSTKNCRYSNLKTYHFIPETWLFALREEQGWVENRVLNKKCGPGETCGTHGNKNARNVLVDISEERECVEVLEVGGRIILKHI